MPLEKGGRADKAGNRYEIDCIIYELLNLINESNYSLVIEALGDDEKGTDILVTRFDGTKEHQQSYFCGIIEKADYYEWSEYVLNMLKDIAVNYIGEIKDKKTEETEIIDSKNFIAMH